MWKANEAIEGLTDELHFLQDHITMVDPIAVTPTGIQDQISDNRVRILLRFQTS